MLKSTQILTGKIGGKMKGVKNLGIAKLISRVCACTLETMSI